MDYSRFVRLRAEIWERFEASLRRAAQRGNKLTYDELEEAAVQYRQVLHDHALAQSRYPRTSASRRLQKLAVEGTRLLTRDRGRRGGGVLAFFTRTFPDTFRRHLRLVLITAALFCAVALLGLALTVYQPVLGALFVGPEAIAGLAEGRLWTESLTSTTPRSVSSSGIATNNLSVAITAWAGGALAGLGSLYIVCLNGFMLGAVIGVTLHYSMAGPLLEFVAAHGPLELSIIVISAAAGLLLGKGLIAAEDRPRAEVMREAARDAFVILGGCLPWLVVLALVEVLISPSPDYSVGFKAALGVALEIFFLVAALNPFRRPEALSDSRSAALGEAP